MANVRVWTTNSPSFLLHHPHHERDMLMFSWFTDSVGIVWWGSRAALSCLCLSLLFIQFFDGLDLLLEFHPSILKPDFDLSLCETQGMSHFNPSPPRQVVISMEFLFQLESLISSVGLTSSPSQSMSSCETCINEGGPTIYSSSRLSCLLLFLVWLLWLTLSLLIIITSVWLLLHRTKPHSLFTTRTTTPATEGGTQREKEESKWLSYLQSPSKDRRN